MDTERQPEGSNPEYPTTYKTHLYYTWTPLSPTGTKKMSPVLNGHHCGTYITSLSKVPPTTNTMWIQCNMKSMTPKFRQEYQEHPKVFENHKHSK